MRTRKGPVVSIRTRIALTTIAIVVTLFFFLQFFYRHVQAGAWSEQDAAVRTAYEQTILASAERVEPFVGDKPYEIVFGADKLGQPVIVWVGEGDVHTEYVADGTSKEAIEHKLRELNPQATLMRLVPGKLLDEYAWEAFFKQKEDDGVTRYYYKYFRFSDGELLDTYYLSLQ